MLAVLFKKLATAEVSGDIFLQSKLLRMSRILQTTEARVRCAVARVTGLLLVVVVVVIQCAAL